MTKLKQVTEGMHSRLGKVSSSEQVLIQALSEALSRADQKLLDDVRNLTIEHEARRVVILSELQTLAARIGAFPATEGTAYMVEENESLDLPFLAHDEVLAHNEETHETKTAPPVNGKKSPSGADWRQAAKNIGEDLEFLVNGVEPSS